MKQTKAMNARLQVTAIALSVMVGGCMSTVQSQIDGRTVSGRSAYFSSAGVTSNDHGSTIRLGGKTVQVTTDMITWGHGRALQLPSGWSRLELTESSDAIVVRVDGKVLASIWP